MNMMIKSAGLTSFRVGENVEWRRLHHRVKLGSPWSNKTKITGWEISLKPFWYETYLKLKTNYTGGRVQKWLSPTSDAACSTSLQIVLGNQTQQAVSQYPVRHVDAWIGEYNEKLWTSYARHMIYTYMCILALTSIIHIQQMAVKNTN